MESKKDIGNYFKENLEQLDYSPSAKVWDGIEVELKEKKKKRRFIFWLFFAAIAIGGLSTYVYNIDFTSGKPNTNNLVTTDSNTNKGNNSNSESSNSNNSNSENLNLNNTDSKNPNSTNLNNDTNESVTDANRKTGKNDLIANPDLGTDNSSKKSASKNSNAKAKPNNSIGASNSDKKLNGNFSKKDKIKNIKKGSKVNKGKASLMAKNKSGKNSKKGKKPSTSNTSDNSNETNNSSKENLEALKTSETIAAPTPEKEKDKKINLDDLKKANQKKRDSIAVVRKADKEKKAVAEQPKDEEKKDSTKTEVTKSGHEIIIAPYYGYNYNGNFGNGNFLNDSKTSKKTSQFKSSYGVLIRWMGSEKIGAQIGVGIINSTYSATFVKENNSFIGPNVATLDVPLSELNSMFSNGSKITSTQETTFIEVPIEGYYVILDKKFGLATSFGISFLKLQKNELFVESDDVDRLKIGKLENISPFSASVNVKLNFFYKISPKLQFDLYPEFQYQLMGIKEVSNYHAYYFSIKTGLSYKL